MLECGQPLHAFDQALLKEGRIVVRHAQNGEKIMTLDGAERVLSDEHLVIADASSPVALAGIMGGEHSGILPDTSSVLLESAIFKPSRIRMSSKKLGLSSESSYRFERGVDINMTEWASRRAASFMSELASGKIARGVIDVYQKQHNEKQVQCRFQYINDLLGTVVPQTKVLSILESLECKISDSGQHSFKVTPPSFRMDIEIEADIGEEVARMYGLENIPAPLPSAKIVEFPPDDEAKKKSVLRNFLCALGLNEVVNYSFTSEKVLATFENAENTSSHIRLPNPISTDHSVLRSSLLPQLTETLGHNRAKQVEEAGLFEMGRIFLKNGEKTYYEEERLAIGIMGHIGRYVLEKRKKIEAIEQFLILKGILEELFLKLHIKSWHLKAASEKTNSVFPNSGFAPSTVVEIYLEEQIVGVCGMLEDKLLKEWRIQEPVALAELKVPELFKNIKEGTSYQPLPAFPFVKRDIAIKASRSITNEMIIEAIKKNAPKELTEVELFDIYEDERLGCDVKSMAYSLTYRSMERTLTDEEVNELHQSVVARLESALGVEIRKS
jgi:phenylalanyl-tRNA synthetase beta chain